MVDYRDRAWAGKGRGRLEQVQGTGREGQGQSRAGTGHGQGRAGKAARAEQGQGPGVEVFVFHWGCTPLGALGDDSRGPTACERGGTEPVLSGICFMPLPNRLTMMRFVPPVMKSSRYIGN